jgi:hypothetical protein
VRPATLACDRIGRRHAATRRPDPRIAAAIATALDDADTVVDVGTAAVVHASAEQLPFTSRSFDRGRPRPTTPSHP